MTFPTLFTVGLHRCTEDITLNDYNELTAIFTPTADQPGTQVAVYGWAVPSSTEPAVAGHDRVIVDVQVYAPPDMTVGAYDLVDIPDLGQFQVIGEPENYDHGPFLFNPGLVINLRKVAG